MLRIWICLLASGLLWGQDMPKAARVLLFEARPRTVKAGGPVELAWATQGAGRVVLEPPGEEVSPLGRRVVTPDVSTDYWLHVTNAAGGQSVPVTVVVESEPKLEPQTGPEPAPRLGSGFWIQFAALANEPRAREIQDALRERAGQPVHLAPVTAPHRPGLMLHRIRMGPFPTRKAAQLRLRELRPGIQALELRPVVMAE